MHFLINASNVTASGPKALTRDLLFALLQLKTTHRYTILLPTDAAIWQIPLNQNDCVIYRKVASGWKNDLNRLRDILFTLPHLTVNIEADACLNLGDLGPIQMPCPQVLFLHNPYFVYDPEELGCRTWPLLKRSLLRCLLKRNLCISKKILLQTPIMAARVIQKFKIPEDKIAIVPQTISQHVFTALDDCTEDLRIKNCMKPIRLLFLAAYYPHKNHKVLPAVRQELRERGLASKVHIFTTVAESSIPLNERYVISSDFADVITNLGTLSSDKVAGALRAATALFLPSLAETFGLIYLEAMACRRLILTSNRDFARWMCQDLAQYFDPLDPVSIVDAIENSEHATLNSFSQKYFDQRLKDFPQTWGEVAIRFLDLLEKSVGDY